MISDPAGKVINYDYGTAGAIDDRLHRVVKLKDGTEELTQYSHNGTGRLVIADLLVPDVQLDYYQGTSGTYAGFGRVAGQLWIQPKEDPTPDVTIDKYG